MTESAGSSTSPGLHVVVVTYRRPQALREILGQLEAQDRPADSVTVVDNEANPANRAAVARSGCSAVTTYIAAPENLGPAGGVALVLSDLLKSASDEDWVTVVDDNNERLLPNELSTLLRQAIECVRLDSSTAGVGYRGGRFSWIKARSYVVTLGLSDRRRTDYLGGNGLPTYRIAALHNVGTPSSEFFFGLDELEFGLRVGAHGYALYKVPGPPEKLHTTKTREGLRLAIHGAPSWRRYYSLRNLIAILREHHHPWVAARVTISRGFAKPLVSLPISPRHAVEHLMMNTRAVRDAWADRMGRRVEPAQQDYPEMFVEAP